MQLEIDVCGNDILDRDYTVCIADNSGLIKGFKFSKEMIDILKSRHGQGEYRYKPNKSGKANLKVRLYCIAVYHIIKSIKPKGEISLILCRDFNGREGDIEDSLNFFLRNKLKLNIGSMIFSKLDSESDADNYAYLMRKDIKNRMNTYVDIKLKDIEKWLK